MMMDFWKERNMTQIFLEYWGWDRLSDTIDMVNFFGEKGRMNLSENLIEEYRRFP